jgi:hypothetical protein
VLELTLVLPDSSKSPNLAASVAAPYQHHFSSGNHVP